MEHYGLIGQTLEHSFSKSYFEKKFKLLNLNACYKNYELGTIDSFNDLKLTPLIGCNVTLPYKEAILPFLDEIDGEALQIGAVNTVKFYRDSEKIYCKGFNTDAFGFKQTLKPFLESHHTHALVLGDGGASKAVAHVLKQYGIVVNFLSRKNTGFGYFSWKESNEMMIKHHLLIINTTPLGMYPNVKGCPDLAYSAISDRHLLIDLIYNPEETKFLSRGKSCGAICLNGNTMLKQQAEKSWEIWKGPY